ncbi:hypothetical protein BSZ32_05770 [Rubritalea profundi]|uniref:Uncharacterized protein n=1 Tax=Rubritalea profundi TaxID=1658618 RepID=A0A2S7TZ85_9BACT|nr:hypothetical protein BSZ32_05770 [Rubritalea profundi]
MRKDKTMDVKYNRKFQIWTSRELAVRGVAVKDLESWSVYGENSVKLVNQRNPIFENEEK